MMSARRAAIAALYFASALPAQQRPLLRGTVVHSDERTAAAAVLIEVIDATNRVAGRTLTSQSGAFALPVSPALAYTVRALRVGYRPTVMRDVSVPDSGAAIRIVLSDVGISLAVARVTTDDKCGVQSSDGGLVATAWEEVRKALASADVMSSRQEYQADLTNWLSIRTQDGDGAIYQDYDRRVLDSPKPYTGVSATEVEKAGYARPGPGGAVDYLGPDAETLTSPIFPLTHCFRLVPPQAERPWLGIAFRPQTDRIGKAVVEIEGTFWIDTASAALRLLEYRYTNAPASFARVGAGGRIEFDRLAAGEWLIRRWTIRLPMEFAPSGSRTARSMTHVSSSGGIVTSLTRNSAELLPAPQRTWRAQFTATDATSRLDGATVELFEGGYFAAADASGVATIADVPSGRYVALASTSLIRGLLLRPLRVPTEIVADRGSIEVRVPTALDLLGRRCGTAAVARGEAVVFGVIARSAESAPGTGSIALVSVIRDAARESSGGQRWRADSLSIAAGRDVNDLGDSAESDSFGRWVACGIPRGSTVRVTAINAEKRVTGVTYARVGTNDRIVEAGTLVVRAP